MSIVQEKMYMDVDDVCAILGVSKAYAYNLMREYNKELKAKDYIVVKQHGGVLPWAAMPLTSGNDRKKAAALISQNRHQ